MISANTAVSSLSWLYFLRKDCSSFSAFCSKALRILASESATSIGANSPVRAGALLITFTNAACEIAVAVDSFTIWTSTELIATVACWSLYRSAATESFHSNRLCVGASSGLETSRNLAEVSSPVCASSSSVSPTTCAGTLKLNPRQYEYLFVNAGILPPF